MIKENFTTLSEIYLKSNAMGRQDGSLKAETHERLCRLFVSEYFSIELDAADKLSMTLEDKPSIHVMDIVRKASRTLTDHLDEQIEFPLDMAPNYRRLTPKFVAKFKEICTDALLDDVRIMTDKQAIEMLNEITKYKMSMIYPALESYRFEFVDGIAHIEEERFLTMRSVLGQEVTVKPNKFFGCSYTLKGLAGEYNKEDERNKAQVERMKNTENESE